MGNLNYYAALPKARQVTPDDRKALKKISFDPIELIHLKRMKTEELKGLMVFCEIRTYEGMPIIACTDDEMRMAYLSWRAFHSTNNRMFLQKKLMKQKKKVFRMYDGLMEWISEI